MSFLTNLPLGELGALTQVIQQSLVVRSHYDLFNWLQNDVQRYIPHDLVVVAWGDFSLGLVSFDAVSPLAGLRTDSLNDKLLQPFVTGLFQRWVACDRLPYSMHATQGLVIPGLQDVAMAQKLAHIQGTLVHGIKDQRGRHDCLYVFMGGSGLSADRPRESLRFLLPYIDTTFRQVAHLPEQYLPDPSPAAPPAPVDLAGETGLSPREIDIMEWVCKGKTNQEIGLILDISAFTVKNHVQRIFRKLDVVNRAQAVSKMESLRSGAR